MSGCGSVPDCSIFYCPTIQSSQGRLHCGNIFDSKWVMRWCAPLMSSVSIRKLQPGGRVILIPAGHLESATASVVSAASKKPESNKLATSWATLPHNAQQLRTARTDCRPSKSMIFISIVCWVAMSPSRELGQETADLLPPVWS